MLSPHFSLDEMIHTNTLHRNVPDVQAIANLEALCKHILEPARIQYDNTILVTSGYRCKEVNDLIGGAKKSQHLEGKAADLTCIDMAELFFIIRDRGHFDQLIWEYGDNNQPAWVHVSFNGIGNRNQVLRAYRFVGKTIYRKML